MFKSIMDFVEKKKEQLPFIVMIMIVYSLYINNMPIDFNINPFAIMEGENDKFKPENLKLFTLSNIVLLFSFIYIIYISESTELRNHHLGLILSILGVYSVLWGIFYGFIYHFFKIKKLDNKWINNVILYSPSNLGLISGISTIVFALMMGIFIYVVEGKGGDMAMFSGIFIFFFGIMFLYLKTDGFVDMWVDLALYIKKEWKKDWDDHFPKLIGAGVLFAATVCALLYDRFNTSFTFQKSDGDNAKTAKISTITLILSIILTIFIFLINRNLSIGFSTYYIVFFIYKLIKILLH
mgnify:CR=1 FL=1